MKNRDNGFENLGLPKVEVPIPAPDERNNKPRLDLPKVKIPATEIFPKPPEPTEPTEPTLDLDPKNLKTTSEEPLISHETVAKLANENFWDSFEPDITGLTTPEIMLVGKIKKQVNAWMKNNPHLYSHFNQAEKMERLYQIALTQIKTATFGGRPVDRMMASGLEAPIVYDSVNKAATIVRKEFTSDRAGKSTTVGQ